tara:strand:- start:587 stop:1069 length:483 start_codon:yes stop_codon:yes gene_type:complete
MDSHEVFKKSFEKTSPKAIAGELGVSLSLVYKWAQEQSDNGSGSRNPLDRLLEIIRLTGEKDIVEWLCQECGGYFVQNPARSSEGGYEVLPATSEIIDQFSKLLRRISESAFDHSITPEEADTIRESWEKLKRYTEGFVRCCEEGDLEAIAAAEKQGEGL